MSSRVLSIGVVASFCRGAAKLRLATVIKACAVTVVGLLAADAAYGATAANAQSSIGVNLNAMNYYSPEQPFLNLFKTSGITNATPTAWSTRTANMGETNEEQYLQLDPTGFPTTLKASAADPSQQFTQVCALLENGLPRSNAGTGPYYRSGNYVALYDGQGTLAFRNDASLVSSASGSDVFSVANPSANGFWICITATDPSNTGNYLRNIRVVKAEEESLLTAGNVFEPNFISLMSRFKVLRAMQWLNTDNSPAISGNWANRSQFTDAGWGSSEGVPFEVVFELCNVVGADCWVNVPHTADNNYITQLATLAHNMVNKTQNVYIEFSNEVWNTIYPQYQYAVAQGQALWPSAGASAYEYNRSWYGMRTAQTCDIWKTVWGADSSRVICVLGAQAANAATAVDALNCTLWTGSGNAPCATHNINAVAIAPYFGYPKAQAMLTAVTQPDGGLATLFASLQSDLASASSWEAAYKAALAPFNLPYVAYEGGQTLVGLPNFQSGSPVLSLYYAANRDARMGTAYTTALTNWKANGGEVYVVFDDIYGPPSEYGDWGLLESFMDTVSPLSSAPPKWQAVQNFITNNACWWANCSGNTTSDPVAPSSIQVSQ